MLHPSSCLEHYEALAFPSLWFCGSRSEFLDKKIRRDSILIELDWESDCMLSSGTVSYKPCFGKYPVLFSQHQSLIYDKNTICIDGDLNRLLSL